MPGHAFAIGMLIVVCVIMALVIGGIREQTCEFSYSETTGECLNSTGGTGGDLGLTHEYNVSTDGMGGIETFGDNFDLIVTIVVMVVILGLVVGGFYAFMRR